MGVVWHACRTVGLTIGYRRSPRLDSLKSAPKLELIRKLKQTTQIGMRDLRGYVQIALLWICCHVFHILIYTYQKLRRCFVWSRRQCCTCCCHGGVGFVCCKRDIEQSYAYTENANSMCGCCCFVCANNSYESPQTTDNFSEKRPLLREKRQPGSAQVADRPTDCVTRNEVAIPKESTEEIDCELPLSAAAADLEKTNQQSQGEDINSVAEKVPAAVAETTNQRSQDAVADSDTMTQQSQGEECNSVESEDKDAADSEKTNQQSQGEDCNSVEDKAPAAGADSEPEMMNQQSHGEEYDFAADKDANNVNYCSCGDKETTKICELCRGLYDAQIEDPHNVGMCARCQGQ